MKNLIKVGLLKLRTTPALYICTAIAPASRSCRWSPTSSWPAKWRPCVGTVKTSTRCSRSLPCRRWSPWRWASYGRR